MCHRAKLRKRGISGINLKLHSLGRFKGVWKFDLVDVRVFWQRCLGDLTLGMVGQDIQHFLLGPLHAADCDLALTRGQLVLAMLYCRRVAAGPWVIGRMLLLLMRLLRLARGS